MVTGGCIRPRGRGWEVRVSIGRDAITGRRRVRTQTVCGDREAAESLLAQWLGLDGPPALQEVRTRQHVRFPLEPLTAISRLTVRQLEAVAGFARGAGRRWATHGLTENAADRVAIRLGLHPALVWTDW